MEVDLQAVRQVFEDVLNGRMSREQADRWAYAVVKEEESGVVNTRHLAQENAFGPV